MYQEGYRIVYEGVKQTTLYKWDFGGDKPYTNRVWNGQLSDIRALAESSYPLEVFDLDNAEEASVVLNNKVELETWLERAFRSSSPKKG
ncbi:MAG: hypothetical protein P8P74_17180 [Crocinitomicaceae bacterium]|nr:hypothetical protein [Crocinitomicaceae bacterium]